MAQKQQGSSLRDVLTVVFKHKFKIVALFLTAIIVAPIAYFVLLQYLALYEASSLLMIRYGREYTQPNLSGDPAPLKVGLSDIVNSEIAILSSRDLKEKALSTLGLSSVYPNLASKANSKTENSMDIAISLFEKQLIVQAVRSANLIRVSFRNSNPQIAAAVVNELVNSYQEKRLEILHDSKPILILENKVAEYRDKLRDSESRWSTFRQDHQIFGLYDQRNLLLLERMKVDATSQATQTQVKELGQRLSTLESQIKTITAFVPLSEEKDGTTSVEFLLLTLQQKEQELLGKYTESNAQVASVRNQIQLTKEFLDIQKRKKGGGPKGTVSEFYKGLQKDIIITKADLNSLMVRSEDLQQQLLRLNDQMQSFDRHEKTFKDLRRDLTVNETNFQLYVKKLDELRISADMDKQKMTSVSVIENAAAPIEPISPKMELLYFVFLAALAGGAIGLGLAFLLERIREGFHSSQKAQESLGLPVLVVIPHQER